MKCPNCKSSNIQSHIIIEDKRSRNEKIIIGVFLVCVVSLCIISLILGDTNLAWPIIIGMIVAAPVCAVLKIVLAIIPERRITIFICNECGAEFDRYEAEYDYDKN